MLLNPVELLGQLVAIPSVNPMGRPLAGPEIFEYRVTEYLEALFTRMGLVWQRQTIEPKRDNIVARLDGWPAPQEGGRLVLLEAHQDTVPVDGMSIEPWTPLIRDGRMYGRGSCDIKGGMSAMLAAVSRLAADRPERRPTVVMACTVNEEHGYTGAMALGKLWEPGGLLPRKPDMAVVAEPTNLSVVVAHKGAVRWRIHTVGRATHSSQPHLGDNAIYKMAKVLIALERYQAEVTPTLGQHALCGRVTLSVGTINGGVSVNTVPERATIEVDRRLLPGDDGRKAYDHVVEYVNRETGLGSSVVHERPFLEGVSLSDADNQAVADELTRAVTALGGPAERIGVPFGTDAATISALGVPSVVFGPGSIDQAHTADEWIDLAELERASEMLYRFLATAG